MFYFFCGKDDVLFSIAVESRIDFQSFNLLSAVQYYS